MRSITKSDIKTLADTIWDSKLPLNYKMELCGGLQKIYNNFDKYSDSEVRELLGLIKDRLQWIKSHDPEVIIGQAIWDIIDMLIVPLSLTAWILTHLKEIVVFVIVAAVIGGITYFVVKLRKAVK